MPLTFRGGGDPITRATERGLIQGYLDCFDHLEEAIIQARNEASRETAEAFLKEVGKKRTR